MLTFHQAVCLFPLAFVLHVLEEWPRFPAWASRYASSQYRRREYVFIHLAGIAGTLIAVGLMWRFPIRPLVFAFFAFLFAPAVLWNAMFHAGATIVYRSYLPGGRHGDDGVSTSVLPGERARLARGVHRHWAVAGSVSRRRRGSRVGSGSQCIQSVVMLP